MTIEALNAACRQSFDAFAHKVFTIIEPGVGFEYNWHIGCVAEHMEAMHRGEIQRLIINIPPRTLKSFLVTRAYPAWKMGKEANHKFICTSYGHDVTEQNAMACRRIMKSEWYQQCFETRINPELDRNTHFETTMAGQYYAASAMSPITGVGANTLLIDDPIKPMEAYSDTIRQSTNMNIRTTLFSRLNDKRTGAICLIMQRVHEDDPTGNLLKDGGWHHLCLPAEAKKTMHFSIGKKQWTMQEGDLLFKSRLSQPILDQLRLDMTEANYVAQYLQEPVPVGGGEFRPEWVQYYKNGTLKPKKMNIVILCDPAGGEELNKKKKKLSDWTAFIVVGLGDDNNYYWLDAVRDRLNPTERVETLFLLHRKWNEIGGKAPKVGYEKYGMMTDTHYIQDMQSRENYRFPLVEIGGNMLKEERIRKLIPDLQNGRWYFPEDLLYIDGEGRKFNLVKELVDGEMASFPRARYDDMLDAMSRIYTTDLHMVFPRPAKTMVQRSLEPQESNDGWETW